MFEGTKGNPDLGEVTPTTPQQPGVTQSLRVGDAVTVSFKAEETSCPAHVVLEWEGGSTSDMIADAVIAIILQVSCSTLPLLCSQQDSPDRSLSVTVRNPTKRSLTVKPNFAALSI